MAKTNNLGDYLVDLASAIKSKTGSSAQLNAQNFASAILGIQTGGDYDLASIITQDFGSVISSPMSISNFNTLAFYNCRTIKVVDLPNVLSIGYSAFANCINLESVTLTNCMSISDYAFYYDSSITSLSVPNVDIVGTRAFNQCYSLTSLRFPKLMRVKMGAFGGCRNVTSISMPKVYAIEQEAFYGCSKIETISLPKLENLSAWAFGYCSKLSQITIGTSSVCYLANSFAFSQTLITPTTGSIFVPASLVTDYKNNTNWAYFSNRIFPIT